MTDAAPGPVPAVRAQWTSRAYLLVAFGGGLVVLATALGNPVPLFAGIPILLAPLLASSQVSWGLSRVDLDWKVSGLGPEATITGTLRGEFGASAADLSVRLPKPLGVTEREPMRLDRNPRAIRFSVGWELAEPSLMTVPPPTVVWRDPLGLTERTLAGVGSPLFLERYPPWPRRGGAIRLARTTTLPGEIRSHFVGTSGDFYGLREAAPGEPPNRINWRATARTGRLLANDYQLERTGDLVVLLDVRPTSRGPELDDRLLGIAQAAAYVIADSLLQNKIRVGFASFGEFVRALPLSTGRGHRARVLRAVVAARRSETASPAERCALGLSRFYPLGVTTLIISGWTGDPTFNLVPYIQRRGFPVVLLSPSPLPMRDRTGGLDAADEPLASRLEQLERRAQLTDLWVHGPVIDWNDYWNLESLAHTLRHSAPRRVT